MKFSQNNLGYFFQMPSCLIFFGNTTATFDKIQTHYPSLNFQKVKQTHSDILVEATDQLVEADAHWTKIKNTALLIATADCIPLMIHCHQTNRVIAVHAGWKGVVNQIIPKALTKMIQTGSSKSSFSFWFGPHILQVSFEVSEDVFNQLKNSQVGLEDSSFATQQDSKYYVDLKKIVISQIRQVTEQNFQECSVDFDTKSNPEFHSYRRGKLTGERNLSFIALV